MLLKSLGGNATKNAQVQCHESYNTHKSALANKGQYRPSVSTILITSSLYEEQNCTSAPGLQLSLERAPVPEGDDAAAASQGQGMLNNGEVGPKEEI